MNPALVRFDERSWLVAWIYAFVEQGESRYVKIGVATSHYHERFEKTQQCNPVPMEIAAAWRFPTPDAAKGFESSLKKGAVFAKVAGGGPEWYRASLQDIHASGAFGRLMSRFGGSAEAPVAFSGRFQETLNLGSGDKNGLRYCPHLYLIGENPSGACKLALSCYNWPTVVRHYITYNPRALEVAARWTFSDDATGVAFADELTQRLRARQINPLRWFRIAPEEVIAIVAQMGATPYARTSPIDNRVDYTTTYRVPAH